MNLKRSTTSMAIALMAVSLISMTSIQQDVFAQDQGMYIIATADEESNVIQVTGKTASDSTDVIFRVTSPSGNNVVDINQISPDDDGNFAIEFIIGPLWNENGRYEIQARQGESSLYDIGVFVEVIDGIAKETIVKESSLNEPGTIPLEPNVATDAGLVLHSAQFVNGDDKFTISGTTDRISQDITVSIVAPNDNLVTVDQISPENNGEFEETIKVGGPLWKEDGFYTVTVKQLNDPKYTASIEVDILEGKVVPEFGAIAAMILAVAIISIIAISARSRLSIMPKY